jgi:hypothetical protein
MATARLADKAERHDMVATVQHSNPARQEAIQAVASARPPTERGMTFGSPSASRKPDTTTPGKRTPEQAAAAFSAHMAQRRKVKG